MAVFSIDNDFPGIVSDNNTFISRAGLVAPNSTHWISHAFNALNVNRDRSLPVPINVNIFETKNEQYLWINEQSKLFSGAPDITSTFAQFTITTPDLSDPSYIQIGLVAFNDPKIVAADFSGESPSLIITDPDAANVVSLFQRGGTGISGSISVIDPSSETTYYWDINDDWAVVLTLQPSEVFILSDIS